MDPGPILMNKHLFILSAHNPIMGETKKKNRAYLIALIGLTKTLGLLINLFYLNNFFRLNYLSGDLYPLKQIFLKKIIYHHQHQKLV